MGFSDGFSDDFEKTYMKLLSDLNVNRDFLTRLEKDDDWSFVVKLHALMEIAISHLLAERLGEKLNGIFNRLDMHNKDYGKMKFIKILDLLDSEDILFTELLGEMRNSFAHDIRMTTMNVDAYLLSLKENPKKKDRYNKWMTLYASPERSEEIILRNISLPLHFLLESANDSRTHCV
jgi:hypothetical protein